MKKNPTKFTDYHFHPTNPVLPSEDILPSYIFLSGAGKPNLPLSEFLQDCVTELVLLQHILYRCLNGYSNLLLLLTRPCV